MRFINVLLYFIIALVIVGTCGIWLPLIIENVKGAEINILEVYQRTTTYFITIIVAGCVDRILSVLKNTNAKNPAGNILFMIFLLLFAVGLVIWSSFAIVAENENLTLWLIIIGVLIAWVLWWVSNYNRDSLDPQNALGGKT